MRRRRKGLGARTPPEEPWTANTRCECPGPSDVPALLRAFQTGVCVGVSSQDSHQLRDEARDRRAIACLTYLLSEVPPVRMRAFARGIGGAVRHGNPASHVRCRVHEMPGCRNKQRGCPRRAKPESERAKKSIQVHVAAADDNPHARLREGLASLDHRGEGHGTRGLCHQLHPLPD